MREMYDGCAKSKDGVQWRVVFVELKDEKCGCAIVENVQALLLFSMGSLLCGIRIQGVNEKLRVCQGYVN